MLTGFVRQTDGSTAVVNTAEEVSEAWASEGSTLWIDLESPSEDDVMAKLFVSDELWAVVEPLLPKHFPSPQGGKPRIPDRVCLSGILFVLKTGIPWEDFPQEMGCCGMTLWNRLHEWQQAGVWQRPEPVEGFAPPWASDCSRR